MKLTDVIRKPLITEKTTVMREDSQTLVFQVAMDANKIDIRRAVEQLLGAKVASVRTALAHGKEKRQGRFMGRRSDWKKAYVKLRVEGRHVESREFRAESRQGSKNADSQIQPDIARPERQDVADLR
jgi:large subunit ribosomal protein L23